MAYSYTLNNLDGNKDTGYVYSGYHRIMNNNSSYTNSIRSNIPKYSKIINVVASCEMEKGFSGSKAYAWYADQNETQISERKQLSNGKNSNINYSISSQFQSETANAGELVPNTTDILICFKDNGTPIIFVSRYKKLIYTYEKPTVRVNTSVNNEAYGYITDVNLTGINTTHEINVGSSFSFDIEAIPKTGYRFVKWSDGDTNIYKTFIVSEFNISSHSTVLSYQAIFEPIPYITYDSVFNFQKWKNTGFSASNGTVSNITNTGFTLTSNSNTGEATVQSPYFPITEGESYKIDIDITGSSWDVYIFFYNSNPSGLGIDFVDGPTRRFSDGFNQGASFTAPTGAVQAAIRVDANGSSNTVKFDNFRIYPDSYSYMSSSVPANSRSNMGTWSIPTPIRTNYVFKGWNTKPDGNGTYYTSSSTYPPKDDLILYSIWKCIISTTVDPSGSGITSGDGVYDFGDSITLTATPNAGYQFVKWSDGSTSQSRPLIVNTSKNYTALFKLNPSFLGDLVTKYVFFGSSPLKIFFNGEKII